MSNPETQLNHEISSDSVPNPWDSLANEAPPFNPNINNNSAEKLGVQSIDLINSPVGILREEFPSGNYLYHGSKNETIKKIIESGFLGNAVAFNDGKVGTNSGYEGISWSLDGIDALPGTDGHIAGFLAAPEQVLGQDTKLVIPSRPAPYEMLQVGEQLETQEFFENRIQDELFCNMRPLSEANSVFNNLTYIQTYQSTPEANLIQLETPLLFDFLNQDWSDEDLRQYYSVDDDTHMTKLSKELFQQTKIPVGAVWMQRVVDAGWMQNIANNEQHDWSQIVRDGGYQDMNVRDMITAMKDGDDNIRRLVLGCSYDERKYYDAQIEHYLEAATPIKIPVESMFFVTNQADLPDWVEFFSKNGHAPKGFVLYDGSKIQTSNFASIEKGDHGELASEVNHAVDVDNNFWTDELKLSPTETTRSGHRGQVLKETEVNRSNIVKLSETGELIVEKER